MGEAVKRRFTAPIDSLRCVASAKHMDSDGGARCMHRRKVGDVCAQHWRNAPSRVKARMMAGATYWDAMHSYRKTLGPAPTFQYKRVDITTMRGIELAEKYHAAGWKMIQTTPFSITFQKAGK